MEHKIRNLLVAVGMLLGSIASAGAEIAVGVAFPGVSIGINVPVYPQLVPIPGHPVYYAPRLGSNYFFYDGMYWVFEGDNWYASSWYNGPWTLVAPEVVPVVILRVPVRYYYRPPVYFRTWRADAPPHWGEHWGTAWAQRRAGWDHWDHAFAPRPAPLPVYQRQYSGNRYPEAEQQQVLHSRNYRYQPRDAEVRQHFAAQRTQNAPAPAPRVTERAPGSSAVVSRTPHAQSAPVAAPRTTQAQRPAVAPKTPPPAQSAPVVASRPSRPAPEERKSARQDQRSTGQTSSLAQGRAPSVQRTQPPHRESADAPRHIAANAPRPQAAPVIQHQAQQPQTQRAQETPRAAEPRKEKERDKGEPQGAEHNR